MLPSRPPGPRSATSTSRRTLRARPGQAAGGLPAGLDLGRSGAAVRDVRALRRQVTARSVDLWRGFAGITLVQPADPGRAAAAGAVAAARPAAQRAARSARRCCSGPSTPPSEERRRIAATLHDGVVQELAATSFVVAGARRAGRAARRPDARRPPARRRRHGADEHRRPAVAAGRHLPAEPGRRRAEPRWTISASGLRSRGIDVRLQRRRRRPSVDADRRALVFRVAQEMLRNVVKHAGGDRVVDVSLAQDGSTWSAGDRRRRRRLRRRRAARRVAGAGISGCGCWRRSPPRARRRTRRLRHRARAPARTGGCGCRCQRMITRAAGRRPSPGARRAGRADRTADDLERGRRGGRRAPGGRAGRELAPDVVLMDLSMPVMDGVEATRGSLAERPSTDVVVLTSFSDRDRVARRAGRRRDRLPAQGLRSREN